MSNWSTYEKEIIDRLDILGYSQQPDNYNIDDPDASNKFNHMGYSIKPIGVQRDSIIANNSYHTYSVELKLSYINTNENSLDANFDLFDDLVFELVSGGDNFPNFVSLIEDPTFEDDDISLQTSIGTIKMYYGLRGCG